MIAFIPTNSRSNKSEVVSQPRFAHHWQSIMFSENDCLEDFVTIWEQQTWANPDWLGKFSVLLYSNMYAYCSETWQRMPNLYYYLTLAPD